VDDEGQSVTWKKTFPLAILAVGVSSGYGVLLGRFDLGWLLFTLVILALVLAISWLSGSFRKD
jgi:hypothetical protein